MEIATVASSEMKNNFDRYLDFIIAGNEIVITKNGKEVGRFVPKEKTISYLTDSLTGILKGDYDLEKTKLDGTSKKYGFKI